MARESKQARRSDALGPPRYTSPPAPRGALSWRERANGRQPPPQDVDQLAINTIRFLSVDQVEAAQSGHPGAPLGQAPLAYLLWTRFLRQNPDNPDWPNRDRFVLSCGHASALLYSLLHLAGYGLPIEELKRFRQLGSKTPGHPEHELTRGVEVTTGPLGQGISNSVGMAIAECMSAAPLQPRRLLPLRLPDLGPHERRRDDGRGRRTRPAPSPATSSSSQLKVFYDDNKVSIDGPTSLSFSEDVGKRFEAYGWRVLRVEDVNDLPTLEAAIKAAEAENERPTLVIVRTIIGYGSPNRQGTSKAHGEALGPEETAATKNNLGWPLEPTFLVPDGGEGPVRRSRASAARSWSAKWNELLAALPRGPPGRRAPSSTSGSPASSPTAGRTPSRPSSPATSRSPPAPPPARCSTPSSPSCRSSSAARPT